MNIFNIDIFVFIMSHSVLSPTEAKQARCTLMLTQKQVAAAINVNRSVYALFEVNRYLLTEKEQLFLKSHFESKGYTFSDRPKPPYREIEGISVPNRIKTEKAKEIQKRIKRNDKEIEKLSKAGSGIHWWTEEPLEKDANKVVRLMAYNYAWTRYLRGLPGITGDLYASDLKAEQTTNGALVNEWLYR